MSNVEDRLAVQDVMSAYTSRVDEKDFARYLDCFHEDVEVEGFDIERQLKGHSEIRDFVVPALAQFRATQHLIGPPLVTLDGDNAHARTDIQASHFYAGSETRAHILVGLYETDFVRTEAGWKIIRHQLIRKCLRDID